MFALKVNIFLLHCPERVTGKRNINNNGKIT